MTYFKDLSVASQRFGLMMDRLGVDLPEGGLTDEERGRLYRQSVQRCARCAGASACSLTLGGDDSLNHPPAYCRNRVMLEAALAER